MHWLNKLYLLLITVIMALVMAPIAFADSGPVSGEELTDLASWATISGALLPFLIGMVLQQSWSRATMATVSAIICAIDAAVITYFEHGLHFDEHIIVTLGLVFVTAQTTYKRLWQPALNVGVGAGLSPFNPPATRSI